MAAFTALVQQNQRSRVCCCRHILDGKRSTALTLRAPDNRHQTVINLLNQAGTHRNMACFPVGLFVGQRPDKPCAVGADGHGGDFLVNAFNLKRGPEPQGLSPDRPSGRGALLMLLGGLHHRQ